MYHSVHLLSGCDTKSLSILFYIIQCLTFMESAQQTSSAPNFTSHIGTSILAGLEERTVKPKTFRVS